jgi:hypothetical protein
MAVHDEKAQSEKYERLKDQAIISLLTAPNIEEAAKALGIGQTTLYRWLRLPEFQDELKEARRQAVNLAIGKLQQSTSKAVQVLQDVAENEEAPASARVSAAKTIIEMSLKAVELDDIIERLKRLEELAEKKG